MQWQHAGKTNWFAIWVSVGVVVVLVAGGRRGRRVDEQRRRPTPAPRPQGSRHRPGDRRDRGRRRASTSLDTYIDFMCPSAATFEETYGEEMLAARRGRHDHAQHPPDLDPRPATRRAPSSPRGRPTPCTASPRADPDAAVPFMQAMFENQPEGGLDRPRPTRRSSRSRAASGVDGIDGCVTDGDVHVLRAGDDRADPDAARSGRHRHADDRRQRRGHRELDDPGPGEFATLFG